MLGLLCFLCVVGASVSSLPNVACQGPPSSNYPFCNTSLSIAQRVANLVSLVHDNEKPSQLLARSSQPISRIGLPLYNWGINSIHGLGGRVECYNGKCPTSFPNPCGLGATFNNTVVWSMGQVIGIEGRSFYNLGKSPPGLDYWSPNININRDPRWGRNQEVPSEDPHLAGQYGMAYTEGVQNGIDKNFLLGIPTLKHWDAYSYEGPHNERMGFNAVVSKFDLASTYFPAFKASVEKAGALGVMCSYNAVNGVPSCADNFLNETLRGQWGFKGYVSSDSGAVENINRAHHYAKTTEDAVADAINAGTDLDSHLPQNIKINPYYEYLSKAVQDGKVAIDTVNTALTRTYTLRMRLGLFDPNSKSPYFNYGFKDINTPAFQEAAKQAALQSMVLLRNEENTLPFKTGIKLAVVGPNANNTANLMGNYLGHVCEHGFDCVKNIYETLDEMNKGGKTSYAEGCDVDGTKNEIAEAVSTAKDADYVVMVLGLDEHVEHEGHDRANIGLPGLQMQLATAVLAVGKPTVLVLVNGGSVSIDGLSTMKGAILEAWYGSTYAGYAVGNVIFGKYNPSGKMPVTVYPSDYTSKIKDTDMSMTDGVGRSYRYYKGTPLFEFGTGLSYTTWKLGWNGKEPSTWKVSHSSDSISITPELQNSGKMSGANVLMVFFAPKSVETQAPLPTKQLIQYKKYWVNSGDREIGNFKITASEMGLSDKDGNIKLFRGSYDIIISTGNDQITFPVEVLSTDTVIPSEKMIGR